MNQDKRKEAKPHDELLLLADLTSDQCLDEFFRPYLHPVSVQTPVPEPPPGQRTITGQMFAGVVRSFANLWPSRRAEALMQPEQVQTVAYTEEQDSLSSTENFARVVVPRTATPLSRPLPHEVWEELLELRTEVMHAARTRHLQTLMICGVESGVGTSFVARQLSRLLADYGQIKVAFLVLVPGQEKQANRLARPALAPRLQFLMRRTELSNLVEIASANGTITLTELLCHCATAEVLQQMKQEFDLIVIDAPAIAMFGEASLLAALMDGVILVAEPHATSLRQMDRAHRRLRKARAKVLGMVFNRQRRL